MLGSIKDSVYRDSDLPDRAWVLDLYERCLNGTIYDNLSYDFHQEYMDDIHTSYIEIHQRRPCTRVGMGLIKIAVDQSASMTFGEGRMPAIECDDDENIETVLNNFIKENHLNQVMMDAAVKGSVGSIALRLRILKNRGFVDVLPTKFLTPEWDPFAPDTLIKVTEKRKVKGKELIANGYNIDEREAESMFWFQRIWDTNNETWYQPWPVNNKEKEPIIPQVDTTRSVQHNLAFCPIIWIKNLHNGPNDLDGRSTFDAAIDTCIEMDYLASQNVAGLLYNAVPTMVIQNPIDPSLPVIARPNQTLNLDATGDAKMLETSGNASHSIHEKIRMLRELAMEAMGGNRASPEKLGAPASGEAQKVMWHPTVMLADNLRNTYGVEGLLTLMRLVLKATKKYPLIIMGQKVSNLRDDIMLTLKWPPFFPPTATDRAGLVTATRSALEGGIMSKETAVKSLASLYDVEDIEEELNKIKVDEAEADARAIEQAAQIAAKTNIEE